MTTLSIIIAFAIGYWLGKEKVHQNDSFKAVLRASTGQRGINTPIKVIKKKIPQTLEEQRLEDIEKELPIKEIKRNA